MGLALGISEQPHWNGLIQCFSDTGPKPIPSVIRLRSCVGQEQSWVPAWVWGSVRELVCHRGSGRWGHRGRL